MMLMIIFLHTLCSYHVLCLPREDDIFVLQTDVSYRGIGAVLSVVRDGEERPVGYFSKKLLLAERNYTASELECLAVMRAADHFAFHLLGPNHFTIVTYHRTLKALKTSKKLNGNLMHWAMAIQTYNFNVEYRKGVQNGNAWPITPSMGRASANDQGHQPSEGGDVRDQRLTYTAGSSLETGIA